MYNNVLPSTGGAAILAGANGVWWLLAAFALIAAGMALARILPKRDTK